MKNLKIVLKGTVIGFASVAIPGLSASTVAIILCLYYKLIDAISSIFKDFKTSIRFLFFLLIGFGIGSLIGANLVSIMYEKHPLPFVFVVLGFIVGSLPKMLRDLRPHIRKLSNWLVVFVIWAILLGFSFAVIKGEEVTLSIGMPFIDYVLLAIVGFITAATLVVPGMDFAIVLLNLGYYNAIMMLLNIWQGSNIGGNLLVLSVYLVSYGIGAFFYSKLIKKIVEKHEVKMQFASFAFVAISPILVIKQCIINNDYFDAGFTFGIQWVIAIILFFVSMLVMMLIYHLNDPNDTRIEAMKIRNLLRFFFTIGIQIPAAIYYLLKMKKMLKKGTASFEEKYDHCIRLMGRINKGGFIYPQYFGREHLIDQPTLYIPNHQGRYDGIAVFTALYDHPCSLVADKSRINNPYYSTFFQLIEGVYVDRTNMRKQVTFIKEMGERLAEGRSFIAFIEGKHSDNQNELQEFQTGILRSAYQSHCAIQPIVLWDSWKVFSISSLKKIKPEVHILEPIYYDEYKDLNKNELADLIKSRMQAKLDEIRATKAVQNVTKERKIKVE